LLARNSLWVLDAFQKKTSSFFPDHMRIGAWNCMPSACAGNATPWPHLSQYISTNQAYKLLYVCDFFCGREICEKVLNTLEILDFICKELASSDQAHRPWISRSSATEGFS
jgi:hypothetical protein